MKRLLLSALAFVTIISFNACSDADLHQESNVQEISTVKSLNERAGVEADASHQREANEKLTKLLTSFGTTSNRFKEEVPPI